MSATTPPKITPPKLQPPVLIDSTTKKILVVGSIIRPEGHHQSLKIIELNERISESGQNMLEVIAEADDGFVMLFRCFVRKSAQTGKRIVILPT